jgi:hypothetical protein
MTEANAATSAPKAPDLTPPTKAAKAPKEPKAAANGEAKPAKEPKAPKAPKEAKPRGNYGYSVNATIQIVPDKETKYRGQRADWFQLVKQFDGKKVSEFNTAAAGRTNGKGTAQTPSGWLRFYVLDGSVRLIPPAAEATPATAAAPAAPSV